ncbi:MAG: GerMN domain-containing protein [Actinomycetota bacterium]|nr:GerMN domain-containing protein [Actinomycetota bacterium]
MKRYAILMLAFLCGLILLSSSSLAFAQEEEPLTSEEEGQSSMSVYFYLDGELSAVQRDVAGGGQMVEFTVLELLNGPSEEESAQGYLTYIPEGVKLQYSTVKQDNSEYSVCLSGELLELKGDPETAAKALAQIERTAMEASGAPKIGVTVAGENTGDQPEDAYTALGVAREESEEQEEGGGGKTVLIVAIVLGVILVGILVFLAIYIPRKHKGASTRSKARGARSKKTRSGSAKKKPSGKTKR